jgi:uncharacterized protein
MTPPPRATPATTQDHALAFACEGEQLIGVLSTDVHGSRDASAALLVVVGGPQVKSGSHRQFTTLCRHVAESGVPAMRFDVRGMGDSSGAQRSFEQLDADIAAAIDTLHQRLPALQRVVLWGLCDGASAALLYLNARRDSRVGGLVLLNPWVRSAETLARAQVKHYYWQRLRQASFWRKLLSGGVALKALGELAGNVRAARSGSSVDGADAGASLPFQEHMLRGAEGFTGPVLWVLSGQDYTAKEFVELLASQRRWQAVLQRPTAHRVDLATADHTCSDRADEQAVAGTTARWLGVNFQSTPG